MFIESRDGEPLAYMTKITCVTISLFHIHIQINKYNKLHIHYIDLKKKNYDK